jgi:dTMP kinase
MIIALEGLDGAGKSVQAHMLVKHFESMGERAHLVHFPRTEGKHFGALIHDYLHGNLGDIKNFSPHIASLLFAVDQFEQSKRWRAGDHIIVDRYYYSNVAYQCAKFDNEVQRNEFFDWISQVIKLFRLPLPHLALYLSTPDDFRAHNLAKRHKDMHEDDAVYQQKVASEYERLCGINWHGLSKVACVDNNAMVLRPDEIHNVILDIVLGER